MSGLTHRPNGLVGVGNTLEMLFEYDVLGRIVGWHNSADEGVLPRFVLGRAHLGVVWRFRSNVAPNLVRDVSRLAGREKGFPSGYLMGGSGPDSGLGEACATPPDRLAMIERILSPEIRKGSEARHEWVEAAGVRIGELWTVA